MHRMRSARRLFPHPSPKVLLSAGPARGIRDPLTERVIVDAARTEAAYVVYASTRYVRIASYRWLENSTVKEFRHFTLSVVMPVPRINNPSRGTNQNSLYSAVQP